MTYIKSFLKGFISTFRWVIDPTNKFELILCLIFLITLSAFCAFNDVILYSIAFGIQVITAFISYLYHNSEISKKVLAYMGLSISLIASIFWVIGIILY
jgi:hypothetical protein